MCCFCTWYFKCVKSDSTEFADEISNEIKKCLPSIVKQVVCDVKQATISKSYADSVKKENKAMLKETVKSTSQNAFKINTKKG